MIKADDGDGHVADTTVEIVTAVPTPTPTPTPPGFEAVFATLSF